jgi:predicted MFS family arabinose efflux permease
VLAVAGLSTLLLGVVAVGAGVTVPPLGSVMRALWGDLLDSEAVATAYSLESVAVEVCFVLGPVLTAAAAALIAPSAAMVLSGVMTLVGGLGLSRNRAVAAVRPHPDRVHALIGPLTSPAVLALLLTVTWIGVGFGAVETAMPAFAEAHGSRPAAAGVLLAVWSLGSMTGGLVYGGLSIARPATRQLPVLVTLFAAAASLPLLATGPLTMALALFGYGFMIAPFFTVNSVLLGAAAPAGTVTEAFAWNSSMVFGGASLGTAVAGALAQSRGPTAALAVTAVAGILTLATSLAGRRRLRVG